MRSSVQPERERARAAEAAVREAEEQRRRDRSDARAFFCQRMENLITNLLNAAGVPHAEMLTRSAAAADLYWGWDAEETAFSVVERLYVWCESYLDYMGEHWDMLNATQVGCAAIQGGRLPQPQALVQQGVLPRAFDNRHMSREEAEELGIECVVGMLRLERPSQHVYARASSPMLGLVRGCLWRRLKLFLLMPVETG